MCPPPIPQMSKNEATESQRQSEAIRCNQMQSATALCFRVFVFWADRKGLCFVFSCFGLAQRACVLCFRVLADPPQNTGGRQQVKSSQVKSSLTRQGKAVKGDAVVPQHTPQFLKLEPHDACAQRGRGRRATEGRTPWCRAGAQRAQQVSSVQRRWAISPATKRCSPA